MLLKRDHVLAPFSKQRSNDQSAKRKNKNGGAGDKDTLGNRDGQVADSTDRKRCDPNNCEGSNEADCCSEGWSTTGSSPYQQRKKHKEVVGINRSDPLRQIDRNRNRQNHQQRDQKTFHDFCWRRTIAY